MVFLVKFKVFSILVTKQFLMAFSVVVFKRPSKEFEALLTMSSICPFLRLLLKSVY